MSGLILDFELSPANCSDLAAGFELLEQHTDLEVLGDKGYISAAQAKNLWDKNRIVLRTIPRSNQKQQVSLVDRNRQRAAAIRAVCHREEFCPYLLESMYPLVQQVDGLYSVHLYQSVTRKAGFFANQSLGFPYLA